MWGEARRSKDEKNKKQKQNFWHRGWIPDCLFLGILAAFGLYLIRGIFAPGFFYYYDLSQHFTESVYVATTLLPKYHELIGWNPYFYLGWPQGQFNPPASYLIYSGLYYLLAWGLSSLTIYKIMLAGFFILPAFAMYFACRLFGLSRITGFIAGFIVIGTAGGFEVGGPLDIIYYGMYEFAAAVALIPLVLAVYHQSISRKSWKLLIIVGVLLSFDFMLHTLAGLFAITTLVVYSLWELLRMGLISRGVGLRKTLGSVAFRFGTVVLIVFGICSFWLIPAYASRSFYDTQPYLLGEYGNYATTYNDVHLGYIFGEQSSSLVLNLLNPGKPALSEMIYTPYQTILASTSPLFYELLLVLALLGGVVALIRSKSRFPAIVIITIIALFLFISLGPDYYGTLWNLPMFHMLDLRPARAAAVARTFLALFVGAGLGETYFLVSKFLSNKGTYWWNKKRLATRVALKVIPLVIVIFLGVTIAVNSYALMTQLPLGKTTSNTAAGPYVPQLFSWISKNVPNSSRVAFEEYTTDDQHLLAASPVETGVSEVGSGYEFWWQGADASSTLESVLSSGFMLSFEGAQLYTTLQQLNAGYVVVWGSVPASDPPSNNNSSNTSSQHPGVPTQNPILTSYTAQALAQYPGDFQLAQQIGPFYVFRVQNFTPTYVSLLNGTGEANVTSLQPQNVVIRLTNVTAGAQLLVRISYFTNWAAYSSEGGKKLSINPYNDTMPLDSADYMSVTLPTSGTYNITLTYTQTTPDTLGNTISWATLLVIFGIFVLGEKRTYDVKKEKTPTTLKEEEEPISIRKSK